MKKKITIMVAAMYAALLVAAADVPSVVNLTAKQRYPWNGLVDISYDIIGDMTAGLPNEDKPFLVVTATNLTAGTCYEASVTALSGDTGTEEGGHHVVWDMSAQGLEIESSNVVFTVAYIPLPLYCVIDLSAGANASHYPVSYMSDVPEGGWTDEYKTTKLVMRRIWPGSFLMRGQYNVTLTKSFYCGVFEVTQKQYALVMGTNPSAYKGDMRPVDSMSYDMIRGTANGAKWPSSSAVDASSFMGKLRAKTGLDFDLPTDAQWEYACRAGTTSNYNNGGDTEDDLRQLGRYSANQSDGKGGYSEHTTVGSYQPNAWGLYDMHGNVWEWCLDLSWDLSDNVTDPKGASSGTRRRRHGGSWSEDASYSTAARVYNTNPSQNYVVCGFRIFRTLSSGGDERNSEEAIWAKQAGVVLCAGKSTSTTVTAWSSWQPDSPLSFTDGLVSHYTFDDNANDDSGNDNNGVIHGVTPTEDRHGNAGGAYHFNGTSAYIEVPDSDSLREVGQTVTVSAWVKPEEWDGNWISVACKGTQNNRQYAIQIGNSQWVFYKPNGSSDVRIDVSKSVMLNEWNHVVMTYTLDYIIAYLNGECVGMMPTSNALSSNTGSLYLGMDVHYSTQHLTGDMDEVRIYNRALSASEVRALYNNDNPVACNIDDDTWLYQYDVAGGVGVVWSGFGDVPSVLNIPESIDGKQVVQIGSYAFYDCTNLENVVLSNNIHTLTVGGNAFNASTMVTIADRDGYEFMGWRNGAGRMVADPFHSGETVTVTPVWRKVETVVIDGHTWTYAVIDGEATIGIGSMAVSPVPDGDVVIPTEIGGYPVTGIASNAFKDCVGMTSLTISSNVTSVGIGAFEGCSGLTNVIIESGTLSCVQSGLMQAKFDTRFDITSSLDDANDAANVSGVIAAYQKVTTSPWEFSDPLTGKAYAWNEANSTFSYFGQMYMEVGKTYVFGTHFDDDAYVKVADRVLVSIQYPESDNKIITGSLVCDKSGWYDVDFRLSDISGKKGSWANIWSSDFGAGYRDDGSTNTTQSGWSRLLDPGDGTVFRCSDMRTVFAGCSNLVSVTMPWSLVSRMSTTFPDAYDKLEAVTLTGDAKTIPVGAFSGCSSLRSIEMPRSVSKIGRQSFRNCEAIERLVVPSGKVIVEDGAFEGCDAIRSVVLPLDISRCGLTQVKFDASDDFTSSIHEVSEQGKVSGVLMGYAYDTKTASKVFADPVYGGSYNWNVENTTFAYAGYMYMETDKSYVFGKYFDDSAYVSIDGIEVLKSTDHTQFATGGYVPDFTGWHELEVRVADGYGEKGPKGGTSGTHPWSVNMGVGWRDDGITNALPESGWHKLMDPGDGSLFRVEANMTLQELIPDSYMLVTNVVLCADSGGRIPANCCKGCAALVDVAIPPDVSHIGDEAFAGCMGLTHVTLPQSVGTLTVGKNAFDVATAIEIGERDGYVFCGWTNVTGNVVADPFHSATANTVSPCWKKTITIAYDANGGSGTMADQMALDGDDLPLASNVFVRVGYQFVGWATTANGVVEFTDGQTIENVGAAADGTVLHAVWKPNAPSLTPSVDTIFPNASQTMMISSVAEDVTILYTTDGSDPAMSGIEYKGPFTVYESCTIRAIARNRPLQDSEETTVTLTRTEGLSEAVNLYGYLMETDENKPWTVVTDVSHDGVSCVRSGTIGHNGMTWLQTSVRKAGTVSFWWKAACEEPEEEDGETYWYDYGSFMVDGVVKAQIADNDTGWQFVSVAVPSSGKHTLRWEYAKDGATSYAPDCIWLDQVQWIPADGSGHTLTTPDPVPYSWLSGYGLGLDSDFESAAKQSIGKESGNGSAWQVWQDYIAGTDPTNVSSVFTASIEMRDGVPLVTWSPNLNTNGDVRTYKVYGSETLEGGGEWQYPTNSLHRFFKVKVELP